MPNINISCCVAHYMYVKLAAGASSWYFLMFLKMSHKLYFKEFRIRWKLRQYFEKMSISLDFDIDLFCLKWIEFLLILSNCQVLLDKIKNCYSHKICNKKNVLLDFWNCLYSVLFKNISLPSYIILICRTHI